MTGKAVRAAPNVASASRSQRRRLTQSKPKQHLVTCIRVRFPDGRLLQGRFAAREPLSAVYEFVRASLDDADWYGERAWPVSVVHR